MKGRIYSIFCFLASDRVSVVFFLSFSLGSIAGWLFDFKGVFLRVLPRKTKVSVLREVGSLMWISHVFS